MGNILDYIEKNRESFSVRPFSDVDSLVLSQLSYMDFTGLVPAPGDGFTDISRLNSEDALLSLVKSDRVPELDARLLKGVAGNPRYSGLKAGCFVDITDKEAEAQFSAVTFIFDDFCYCAYRGTDSSFVAWKEDFNLAFQDPVPSQLAGAAYLDWVADVLPLPLRAGGHSKGGNLAVYSACFCGDSTRERIETVYSHDGPGFSRRVLESPEFKQLQGRISKTIPHSSLVGTLLETQEEHKVIKSNGFWLLQHDPYLWIVEDGDFVYMDSLAQPAAYLDRNLNEWISSLGKEELSRFADALYKMLCALPGESFNDQPDEWWQAVKETLNGLKDIDRDTYSYLLHTVWTIVPTFARNLPRPALPQGPALSIPKKHEKTDIAAIRAAITQQLNALKERAGKKYN